MAIPLDGEVSRWKFDCKEDVRIAKKYTFLATDQDGNMNCDDDVKTNQNE